MTTLEYADSLHQLADWYEAHPDAPVPYDPTLRVSGQDTPDDVARIARDLAPCEKSLGGVQQEIFKLTRAFGGISFEVLFWRSSVCTRRVIGTVSVPEQVIQAYTKELVEWDCPDSVLSHDPA